MRPGSIRKADLLEPERCGLPAKDAKGREIRLKTPSSFFEKKTSPLGDELGLRYPTVFSLNL
jgi:hypothetical protein